MSSQVASYGRPGSLLNASIGRGAGHLTESQLTAWQIGEVVGYAPVEKPPGNLGYEEPIQTGAVYLVCVGAAASAGVLRIFSRHIRYFIQPGFQGEVDL